MHLDAGTPIVANSTCPPLMKVDYLVKVLPWMRISFDDDVSGRPFRIRADHSCPQRGQLYHAITHVLSAAGSTGRSQIGQDIRAVVASALDTKTPSATIVPCAMTCCCGPTLEGPCGDTGNYVPARAKNSHRVACCGELSPQVAVEPHD